MRSILTTRRGFTLVEILVVMAISIILLGLVLAPVVQSFRMTRGAQAMADAQDAARSAMEQISREVGEAMFVYDNTTGYVAVFEKDQLPGTVLDQGTLQVPVRQADGGIKWFPLSNARIDLILPKITMHCCNPGHPHTSPRDYPRGDNAWPPCPVCQSTNIEATPTVPLQPGVKIVRYFLGLRYNDPSKTDPATLVDGEGLFGWRSPWGGNTELGEENQVVLYRAEFDPSDDTLFPEDMSVAERLSDPVFFYRPGYCTAWARVAQVVGVGQYEDLITAESDRNGNVTSVEPCVTFRFAGVDNDPFTGTYAQDKSFEYPDTVPMIYSATYGYWTTSGEGITVLRTTQTSGNEVQTEYTTKYVDVGGVPHLMIMKDTGGGSETEEFDITEYLDKLAAGNLTEITTPDGSRAPEMAFIFDYARVPASGGGYMNSLYFNRGIVNFALTPPKPNGDAHIAGFDATEINEDFRRTYNGTGSVNADRGSARRTKTLPLVDNARIVPGSERVIGPDMTPPVQTRIDSVSDELSARAHNNLMVTYKRVPLALGDPGVNQYKIDYDTGDLYFSSVYDQNLPTQHLNGTDAQIFADYKIYFNRAEDVVKGSYTTRELVNIHIEMRMFDPESSKPHTVDLNSSVKVRNALR